MDKYSLCTTITFASIFIAQLLMNNVFGQRKKRCDVKIKMNDITMITFDANATIDVMNEITKKMLISNLSKVHTLNLIGYKEISGDMLNMIDRMDSLHTLDVRGCEGIGYMMDGIMDLQTIRLIGCKGITSDVLRIIARMNNLRTLEICDCHEITHNMMEIMAYMENINTLILKNTNLTDRMMDLIGWMGNLHTLDVGHNENITDSGIYYLSNLIGLKNLSLEYCTSNITGSTLKNLKNLHSLKLWGCDNIDLRHFENLSGSNLNLNLKTLSLTLPLSSFYENNIDFLKKIASLKELSLDCTKTMQFDISVGTLSNLESLIVYGGRIKSLPDKLQKLTLCDCPLDKCEREIIYKCDSIEKLCIRGPKLSDDIVKELGSNMKNVEELDLDFFENYVFTDLEVAFDPIV